MNKKELYFERLQDDKHPEKMFVESSFFRTKNATKELKDVVRKFNDIVERETESIEYSVILTYGITKTAADFLYQYKRFWKYVRDNGLLYHSIKKEFKEARIEQLRKSITWKNATGVFTLPKTIFEETKDLSSTAFRLLILYKAYSSRPNVPGQPFVVAEGGKNGLSDTRAAEILGCSTKTVQRCREELENKEFIRTYYFDGRFRKYEVCI